MAAAGSRETKFGYGFLLVGAGLPYLIDKLFGPVPALIAAALILLIGVGFLAAGHLDRDRKGTPRRRGIMEIIGMFTLVGAASGALIGSISGAIWKVAHEPHQNESARTGPVVAKPQPESTTSDPAPAPPTHQPTSGSVQAPSDDTAQDVSARIVDPKSLAVLLLNTSSGHAVVREPEYTPLLWDLDLTQEDINASLPMWKPGPISWLRKDQGGGPSALISPQATPLVKTGDRIFGFVTVSCPACTRTKAYWVFAVYGTGGWFGEVPESAKYPSIKGIISLLPAMRLNHEEVLKQLPIVERVQITEFR